MRTLLAGLGLLAVGVVGLAVWIAASQRSGSTQPVTSGDTGWCIGRWSQPSNAAAQGVAARTTGTIGSGLPLVAVDVRGGRCRVAVAASSSRDAVAHLFEVPAGNHGFRQLDSPERPLRVADLPPDLRRWVTRVNVDGTLIGHP